MYQAQLASLADVFNVATVPHLVTLAHPVCMLLHSKFLQRNYGHYEFSLSNARTSKEMDKKLWNHSHFLKYSTIWPQAHHEIGIKFIIFSTRGHLIWQN